MTFRRSLLIFILMSISLTSLHAQVQRGKATYYSKRATGSRTASGERLHHDSMTCAHRSYPFGTLLKVTCLDNDKSVVVRVTDRGPFIRGRIIDLSWGAAKKLGILAKGVAMVRVEPYKKPTIVPYKPEDDLLLPEIDFQISDADYSFIDELAKRKIEQPKQKDAVKKHKNANGKPLATKQKAAKAAGMAKSKGDSLRKTMPQKGKTANAWSDVLTKLKNWEEEMF